jgi:hypothetical protein
MNIMKALNHPLTVMFVLLLDTVHFLSLGLRSNAALRAENLFLREQLALHAERRVKARRANDGARLVLALLSRSFAWKDALVIVKPETLIRRIIHFNVTDNPTSGGFSYLTDTLTNELGYFPR